MKQPVVRVTFAILIFAADAALLVLTVQRRSEARRLREWILADMRSVALPNRTFQRFGSVNDCGDLMFENLIEPIDAAYSYGVGPNADWDRVVTRRYHVPVHQYDPFDPARPTCAG